MELKLARRNYTLNSVLCATKSKMWLISRTKTPIRLRLRWLMVGRTDWEASHTHISLLLFFFISLLAHVYANGQKSIWRRRIPPAKHSTHTHTHIHITTQAHISYIASIGAICYAQTDGAQPIPKSQIQYHTSHSFLNPMCRLPHIDSDNTATIVPCHRHTMEKLIAPRLVATNDRHQFCYRVTDYRAYVRGFRELWCCGKRLLLSCPSVYTTLSLNCV